MFKNIPDSIWLQIFSFLTKKELLITTACVCKTWRRISCDKSFWKHISIRELGVEEQHVTDALVERLISYGKDISSLYLQDCALVTDKPFRHLSRYCFNLRVLNIEGCLSATDSGINLLSTYCRSLREINLMDTSVTEKGLMSLLKRNKDINEMVASSNSVTLNVIKCLSRNCELIEVLHVERSRLKNRTVPIKKSILSDTFIKHLVYGCHKLTYVILKYDECFVSNTALAMLGYNCRYLECLEIDKINQKQCLTDDGLVALCVRLSKLQALSLNYTKITDLTLYSISKFCKDIRQLDLGRCENITDEGVDVLLKNCTKLESLSFAVNENNFLTELSISALIKAPCAKELMRLSIDFWNISDLDIYLLAINFPSLMYISLQGCKNLTTSGLHSAFALWENLVEINLSFTKCIKSDLELFLLASTFAGIERLSLYGCNSITASGIKMLEEELPKGCVVESELIF